MHMRENLKLTLLSAGLALFVGACGGGGGGGGDGGGGGGGGGSSSGASDAQQQIVNTATTSSDGGWSRVDILDGGDSSAVPAEVAKRELLAALMKKQTDLNGNLADGNGDGVADTTGLEAYSTGLDQKDSTAKRIYAANNVYDLFQTTTGNTVTGRPVLSTLDGGPPPFTGGDQDGDGVTDGGPGLYSNIPTPIIPKLPPLPNTMGTAGRGPSASSQHQFIQIEFPYKLQTESLFNFTDAGNSFLGDLNAPGNVLVEARWVTRAGGGPGGFDTTNVVDHTAEHRHVSGVAVIGGVCAVPIQQGASTLSLIQDPVVSNVPVGAREKILDPKVFTYIAHENPALITLTSAPLHVGFILPTGALVLPSPTDPGGLGGRVFGANTTIPSAVNDFATSGDQAADVIGFVSFQITRMKKGNGTAEDVYFHSFPVSQENVGADPKAVDGSFNRGPAIEVDIGGMPAINLLSSSDYLGGSPPVNPPTDAANSSISTKSIFRVDFDKEVVPNSVGFSKRMTIHSVEGKGVVFPYSGNTRPITSPSTQFSLNIFGAPLAPSIYVAVNQPVQVAVNNPLVKSAGPIFNVSDEGTPIADVNSPKFPNLIQGLFPTQQNTLATLPRGVIPCDIYPVNQNNLQAYIIEPLVDLPPGTVVTLGVCMNGLGMSSNTLPATVPATPTNFGNYTRSGTMFTPWQGLTSVGLGDTTVTLKQATLANQTVIKVNGGPMDLQGLLFFGGTAIAIDTLIDGNLENNLTMGGWNVSRTFTVGEDLERPYVNAPVAPQAIVVGFGNSGLGAIDLNGEGFNTNVHLGGLENTGEANKLVTSRYLPLAVTGSTSNLNWDASSSLAGGANSRAYGVLGRYTSGSCQCTAVSFESEFAVGIGIPLGPIALKRVPGVNEGSSGYETMVRNSFGGQILSDSDDIGQVLDMVMGEFLDSVYYDVENPFLANNHVTYNTPALTGVQTNTISDPPVPNPPPMRLPEGLPLAAVIFDQAELGQDPVLISGSEVFSRDYLMRFDDGTGISPFTWPSNTFLNLNPTSNSSNPNLFDIPLLPNAGFPSPFAGEFNFPTKFLQTGPMPKTTTAGTVVLTNLNTAAIGTGFPGGLQAPNYQSRQQIGNFLFVTDGVNKALHAVNTNNFERLKTVKLPDPFAVAINPDGSLLYVTNEGGNSLSVVNADASNAAGFMTEVARVDVGEGPRAVAVSPDNEDVFVLNRLGNTISIVDVGTNTVRRTLSQSGINLPNDVAIGVREVTGGPGFQSGTYHAFIANGGGNNVLIFEGGPSGLAGIGFDNIIGTIAPNEPVVVGQPTLRGMSNPTAIVYDPNTPLDGFAHTIGAFVAHSDSEEGNAMVSRIAYTADSSPGQVVFNTTGSPGFGDKVFTFIQQYVSESTGKALDVALPDYNRDLFLGNNFSTFPNLFNAGGVTYTIGGTVIPRNSRFPLAQIGVGQIPRWDPDRLYLSVGGGTIDVFDVTTSVRLKTIATVADATVMASYFGK